MTQDPAASQDAPSALWLQHSRLLVTCGAASLVVLSIAWIHLQLGGTAITTDYDDIIQGVAAWLATASCFWASRRGDPALRRFWRLVAVATFTWGLGEAVWDYYQIGVGGQVPFPSFADLGFLAEVPLMVAALLAFPVMRARSIARTLMLLDGALVASSMLFISWALVLGPVFRAHQGSAFAQTVSLAYPAGDLIIVVVLLAVAGRASLGAWRPLGLVGAGVLALALSDSTFAYLTESGSYGSGSILDVGWISGFLLMAIAPVWCGVTSVRVVSERPSRFGLLLPYIPVAGALAVSVGYLVTRHSLDPLLMGIGLVIVATLAGRQALALLDSVAFGDEQIARFAALVRRSTDLITIVAADGTILYQSPSSLPLLGWQPEEIEGRRFEELVEPGDAAAFMHALAQATRAPGGEATGEWCLQGQFGKRIDAESRIVNLLDDPSVRGITINSRDVSERRKLEDAMRNQVVHDPLTGLANRTLLNSRLDRALSLQKRDQRNIALLFLDLDDFAVANRSLGAAVGDELLVEVARRIAPTARGVDTVARLGSDEFALVLDGTGSPREAEEAAERILAAFDMPFTVSGAEPCRLSVSVGITTCADGVTDAATLLLQADLAMAAAKAAGKGRWERYRDGVREQAADTAQLVADLRLAVAEDGLDVYYQPIVELGSGTIVGVEAVLRWQHPTRGLLTPAAFRAEAERSGLIVPMGRRLLEQASVAANAWARTADGRPLRLHVQLGAAELSDPKLVTTVSSALEASGLAPDRLTLETREDAIAGGVDAALAILNRLKGLGVRLALSTNEGPRNQLVPLVVDELKLDAALIALLDAEADPSAAGRVCSIVALAADFELSTLAEGVETAAQLAAVRAAGCVLGQGRFFAPPLTDTQVAHGLEYGTLSWPVGPAPSGTRELVETL